MSDPLATLSDLLQPVFADLAGGEAADPTVRPSDRADAQVQVARRMGELAEAGVVRRCGKVKNDKGNPETCYVMAVGA